MQRYNPKVIEPKWQKIWAETELYKTDTKSNKPKVYVLDYFPYPSGSAMHMGHVRNYTISDVVSRFERMKGNEVLHPMGWDSFGLPAENYAIKNNISPRQAIDENTKRFKEQFNITGMSYDWSREIDSSSPEYYKWTQWFFLMLFNKGLAYRKNSLVNWCPTDKTVLANEQVVVKDGANVCERCGSKVQKKELKQWFFKITDYADRLLEDLDELNWPESIKTMQRNWIGRSFGANIDFVVDGTDQIIKIFTTRADTIFGATFMVLAPEHPLVEVVTTEAQMRQVRDYIKATAGKTELDRKQDEKKKSGVFTGAYAINPATKEKIPIWIGDFVLMSYGEGAVMSVPAHDQRDFEFAQKYNLPIIQVVSVEDLSSEDSAVVGEGEMINSGVYDGMSSSEARDKIVADLGKQGVAQERKIYKLRDWLISRQRYWGAPIPIVHCAECGEVAAEDKDLPVELPEMADFHPSGDGRGPLARDKDWVKVKCPKCGKVAERETDTMDGFACSSWYFLRFVDPHNNKSPADPKMLEDWLPVDKYIGGAEHAVMHLLYARFWTKVMYDEGLVSFKEPFSELRNQGMLQAEDGQKISKRLGNYLPPETLIENGYGADALRATVLFLAPYDQDTPWSNNSLTGLFRFITRVWTLVEEFIADQASVRPHEADGDEIALTELARQTDKTIKKVSHDLEHMDFNTAISAMMELVNAMNKLRESVSFHKSPNEWRQAISNLLRLMAPIMPHVTEELWVELGREKSIHLEAWPTWDESLVKDDLVNVVVQVNGKLRGTLLMAPDASEAEVVAAAKNDDNIKSHLAKGEIKKTIYVKGRLVNFVV
jgi:leucyl-tRNA synthetase